MSQNEESLSDLQVDPPPHTAPVEVPSCGWHGAHVRPGLGDGLSRHSLGPRARTETGSCVNVESNA